jgi:hypothetical protein
MQRRAELFARSQEYVSRLTKHHADRKANSVTREKAQNGYASKSRYLLPMIR